MSTAADHLSSSFVERRAEPAPAAVAVRTGSILLARHGEPALSRRVKLNAEGYRRWWAKYEEGGLLHGQVAPPALVEAARDAERIYTSVRPRSIETARAVCAGREFQSEDIFIEAPLPPPAFPSWLKLTPRQWGVISRFWWWWFNHHAGQESRRQAETRARAAADRLIAHAEAGHDVLVVAHGFFNAMIGVELRKLGWRCTVDKGYGYWSTRRFEKR